MKELFCFLCIFLISPLWGDGRGAAQPEKFSISSKKAISQFKKGLEFYESKRDTEALEALLNAIKTESNFIEARMLLGSIYYDIGECEKSVIELKKAIEINPKFYVNNYFTLAASQFCSGDFSGAVDNIRLFIAEGGAKGPMKEKAERYLKKAEFIENAVKTPVPFDPKNLGDKINSAYHEYFPTFTADEQTLIITRRIPRVVEASTSKSTDDEDFFISSKDENGNWKIAEPLGPPINSRYREGAQCVSPDGQYLYFTGCNRPDGKGLCDIYVSRKQGNVWTPPANLGSVVNTAKWESQPSLASDGRTLYFASDRPGGKGWADIWKTVMNDDGYWSKPVNLEAINTSGKDEAPFIHPDNKTLYYSSDALPGMGGMDLFVVRRDSSGEFRKPVNLGYPINTQRDENTIVVSTDGKSAYYASDRPGGIGKLDIYRFELSEQNRPGNVTYVKGVISDAKTKKRLSATCELLNLQTGDVAAKVFSNENTGEYLVCLPSGNDYALNVSKSGYLFHSENFSLLQNLSTEPYKLNVAMHIIAKGEKVVLKNIFFETASYDLKQESKAELDKLVAFLNLNSAVVIEIGGHTDNTGSKESNKILSQNRAKSVYDYLGSKNIPLTRIDYKGYGDTQPIAGNDTEEGKAQNRRTEFKVVE